MRAFWVFAAIVGVPLAYLALHSYGFRLNKEAIELQEEKRRCDEVCDSLQAVLAGLTSKHRIEGEALARGLIPAQRPAVEGQVASASAKPAKARPTLVPARSASRPVSPRVPDKGLAQQGARAQSRRM
jgi:hypothetical protein